MTGCAVLFVHVRAGKKIWFVGGYRRLNYVLFLDMCVQGLVRQFLLKRHWRIANGDRCHA
jgi:hypothetical protein